MVVAELLANKTIPTYNNLFSLVSEFPTSKHTPWLLGGTKCGAVKKGDAGIDGDPVIDPEPPDVE